jgi:hypothetical protein
MRLFFIAAIFPLILFVGCSQDESKERHSLGVSDAATVTTPAPPDVGDVTVFNSCKALPRRELTSKEACQIEHLKRVCSPSSDCLVTCLNSPDALKVGGGCNHVCFSYLHKDSPPPEQFPECFQ